MNEKTPPKYNIKEKTPSDAEEVVPSKALLKKLVEERKNLEKERNELELVIKKVEDYKDSIKELENRKKELESTIQA